MFDRLCHLPVDYEISFNRSLKWCDDYHARSYLTSYSLCLQHSQEWASDLFAPNLSASKPVQRQVFLATDDPSLFQEAKRTYPHYVFHGSSDRSASGSVDKRSSPSGITGIALDIILLSQTDYLVCTFSSQVSGDSGGRVHCFYLLLFVFENNLSHRRN